MGAKTFRFNGKDITARDGQSLAAALTEAGVRAFRDTAKDAERGIFCGMGVCQDCLVTIDGVPNRRACMTPVEDGMEVARQVALPEFGAAVEPPSAEALRLSPDVLVIGGGAGGLSAASTAAEAGANVVLIDERKVAGGQYYKQAADKTILDQQQAEGARLVERTRASGAQVIAGVELWGAFDGLRFFGHRDGVPVIATPKTAIIATGAYERPVPVPGWTMPGVMTTGAAQTLWRSYQTLPGMRIAVCGSGPLNVQVALELGKGGAEIVYIAERAKSALTRPLAALSMAASDPKLTLQGLGMLAGLRRHGIKVHTGTELIRVTRESNGLAATFRGASGREETVQIDALCMNGGFEPQNEILRLLGAQMHYDTAMGHLRCEKNASMETSVTGVYAIGDCTGLGGAPAARIEGEIAGASAAAATGHGNAADLSQKRRKLAKHRLFQKNLWRLYDIAPKDTAALADDTILCRCEELTVGDVRAGLSTKPGHIGTLKRATRVGMGRCQGRYCGPLAAQIVSQATGQAIDDLSFFAPRVPIKPVAISTILAAEKAARDCEEVAKIETCDAGG
ncbi:MAG: (2Fe-2S)-binding protein [Roseibium sp.]|nr:(2Fe-2S)-binding protein [Roseibium sp.]